MTKKGEEAFESDLDLGGFGASDAKERGSDFEIDEMPVPGAAAKPKAQAASQDSPQEDFSDFGGNDDQPVTASRPSRASSVSDADFGFDEDQPRQAPGRGRPSVEDGDEADFGSFRSDEDEPSATKGKAASSFDEDDEDERGAGAEVEVGEGFNEGDEEDEEEGDEEQEPADRRAQLVKIATMAGAALLAVVGSYGAWNYVLKPYIGPLIGVNDGPVAAVAPPTPVGQQVAPRASGSLPPLGTVAQAPSPSRPALPPQTVPAPVTTPSSVPAPAQARPDQATLDRLARLEAMVQELVAQNARRPDVDQKLQPIAERLAAIESRGVAQMPKPTVDVPLKPEVLGGWKLKGVSRGVAWVEGPGGAMIQVKAGDSLPNGAGLVKQISKYENDFVVVTERGVIVRK